MLLGYFVGAQNGINVGIYQDAKLAVAKDNHGNSPFTLDTRLEVMLAPHNVKEHMMLGLTLEYADLSEFNYFRYGVQGGYSWNEFECLGLFDYNVAVFVGGGIITRNFPEDNDGFLSLEASLEYSVILTDRWFLALKGTMTQRGDLEVFGDDSASFRPWHWKPNFYIGIKYTILE